jgi:large subunit ribosomal protein L29
MKASELREMSKEALQELLVKQQDTAFRLRLQHYTGQLKRVSSLGSARREIAKIKTVLHEKKQG